MSYQQIVSHYESCLDKYGDTHQGVDWPCQEDAITRYRVMLGLVGENSKNFSLLDFGCGTAHLYDLIREKGLMNIHYSGLDISEKFIAICRKKHPHISFFCSDILTDNPKCPNADYIVMNGVFTEKRSLSYDDMSIYFKSVLKKVFPLARRGIAFNVMSKQVDWERNDLFHLSLDQMSSFVTKHLSRHFVVRNDYGLYEYTVYLYHEPVTEF